jgi:hypothetical protein
MEKENSDSVNKEKTTPTLQTEPRHEVVGNEKKDDQYRYRHRGMDGTRMAIAILVVALIALSAFWLGQSSNYRRVNINRNFGTFEGGGMMSGRYGGGHMFRQEFRNTISGQVTNINGNNLTVKSGDGTTYTVILSTQTSFYNAGQIAKQSDLKVNDNISVLGTPNSNGDINATEIQFNT